MRNGHPYLGGGGRYIQKEYAAGQLAEEIRRLGYRRAFILGGRTALSVALGRMETGLRQVGIALEVETFAGHCSRAQVERICEKAERFGADVMVGVGGGKAIDTAKAVAHERRTGIVTVPTSSATCAAYAALSVWYSDDGDVLGSTYFDREVQCVLVDTDILSRRCPPRMLSAGIADAAAKYPEIAFSMDYARDWEKSVLPSAALSLAKFNWDFLEAKGPLAVAAARDGRVSPELEDVVCSSIALTGTVSSMVSGGRQLAIAHTLYDSICRHFKDQQRQFLHGEIVSAGIPLQMYVNGMSPQAIERAKSFLGTVGTPVRMKDLGIEATERNIETIYEYVRSSMELTEPWMQKRLREGLAGVI